MGGPLTFLSWLRDAFDAALKVKGLCPENSLYYVALGAAFSSATSIDLETALANIANYGTKAAFLSIDPLFNGQEEYEAFRKRHEA